ncbi:phage major capsid protein [Fretibacter rubidus]|uniref:phage major capsid protein n=1 Tax=Fretibacter rubidus TaxID=570162 RepID=UPI00352A8277
MSDTIETKMQTKTAFSDFSQTFEAFKDANDERLAQIEAKSSADSLTTAKVERINAALDDQAKRIERLSIVASQPAMGQASAVNLEAKSAWADYIRSGDVTTLKSLEGKSVGTVDSEGGYVAPIEAESMIDRALEQSSPFRSIAAVRRVGAGQFKKPVSPGGASAGWAGETDARLETTAPQLDLLEFPAGELYAMPAATQMLLDDGVADVDQWLADEVRDVFSNQETAAFINGDGVNKPRGLLDYAQAANASQSWGSIGTVNTGIDGDFDTDAPVDGLLDLVYAPATRYRSDASFVMNRRTVSAIRKFKDADGNYIWQPATEAGAPSTLLGYKLVEVEDMPDIASGTTPIAFGDFRRGYLIVDRQGVRVLRDPYSAKPYVLFYTTKRVGGGVQDFNAIKLLKFAA